MRAVFDSVVFLTLAASLVLLGRLTVTVCSSCFGGKRERLVFPGIWLLAGMTTWYLALVGCQLVGIRWTRASLLLVLLALFLALGAAWAIRRRIEMSGERAKKVVEPGVDSGVEPGVEPDKPSEVGGSNDFSRPSLARQPKSSWGPWLFGWGDVLALLAVLLVSWFFLNAWSAIPDFQYHWGLKAQRFATAGAVDFEFLGHPELNYAHPDYPNLWPALLASQTVLAGHFEERTLFAWSVVFFLVLLLEVRGFFRRQVGAFWAEAGTATIAGAVGAFCIGFEQAGAVDLPVALCVTLAAIVLTEGSQLRPATPTAGPSMALAFLGATAICLKLEGLTLAAIIGGLALFAQKDALRGGLHAGLSAIGGSAPRSTRRSVTRFVGGALGQWAWWLAPPLTAFLVWWIPMRRFGLFVDTNLGSLKWANARALPEAIAFALDISKWNGFGWLVFLAPGLLLFSRTRFFGFLTSAQLGFYFLVYVADPVDVKFHVLASFARLVLHLLPVVLMGLFLLSADGELEVSGVDRSFGRARARTRAPGGEPP